MAEWSPEQCLELIGEYEKHPLLWNPQNINYFSKNKKNDAWRKISNQLGVVEEIVRQKMTSLLGSFRQQRAKGKRSIGTGKARKEVYNSKWFAFPRMHFLLDRNKPRKTINTQNETLLDTGAEADCGQTRPSTPPNDGDFAGPSGITGNVNSMIPPPPTPSPPPPSTSPPPPPPPPPRKKTRNEEDPRVEQTFQILQDTYEQINMSAKVDRFTTYGEHIAHKLRLYSVRVASIVEHHVNNVMFQADMGHFDNYISYAIPPTTPFTSHPTPVYPSSPTTFIPNPMTPTDHETVPHIYSPHPQ